MVRWLVTVFVLIAVAVVAGPVVLAQVPDARSKVTGLLERKPAGEGQSAAQLSGVEFGRVERGMTTKRLRALVGDPETSHRTTVEGLEIECLYYGVVAASGSYQFCFTNGKLSTKARFRG